MKHEINSNKRRSWETHIEERKSDRERERERDGDGDRDGDRDEDRDRLHKSTKLR